ncbi:P-loop containing nucleoside triphosphate hydrolase protein, partial [Amanita muscaria]
SEHVAKHLRCKLGPDLDKNIVWFHSGMSPEFRRDAIEKLKDGHIWGIICTDAAGMGLDIGDIELVVQWKYTASICTLVQRLGRSARHPNVEATGIYLVESQYFDESRERLRQAAEKRAQKRKAADQSAKPASKRRRAGAPAEISLK